MRNGGEDGFEEAITGVLSGIILTAFLEILPTLPNLPSYSVDLFQLMPIINLIGGIVIVVAFESWGFWYLLGWLCGNGIMAYAGFVEPLLMVIYVIVGVFVLAAKLLEKARHFRW